MQTQHGCLPLGVEHSKSSPLWAAQHGGFWNQIEGLGSLLYHLQSWDLGM